MPFVVPIVGIILYSALIIGAAVTIKLALLTSAVGISLLVYAVGRLCWEISLLADDPVPTLAIILFAVGEAASGLGFTAFLATLLFRTGFAANATSSFGMWRVGSRQARAAKLSIAIWVVLVLVVTILEVSCILSAISDSTVVNPREQCGWHGAFERTGLAVATFFAAVALGVMGQRVLVLHKQAATKVGKPSRALILSLALCAAALAGRMCTMIAEASEAAACALAGPASCTPRTQREESHELVIQLFAVWLPELLPPLLLFRLLLLARKLHRKRNRHTLRGSGSGGSGKPGGVGSLRGAFGSGSCTQLLRPSRVKTMPMLLFHRGASGHGSSSGGLSKENGGIEMQAGDGDVRLLSDDGAKGSAKDEPMPRPSRHSAFKDTLTDMLEKRRTQGGILTRAQFEYVADGEPTPGGNPQSVDVYESMEESSLAFAVAAAYVPVARAALLRRVDELRDEVLAEASRRHLIHADTSQLDRNAVGASLLAGWQGEADAHGRRASVFSEGPEKSSRVAVTDLESGLGGGNSTSSVAEAVLDAGAADDARTHRGDLGRRGDAVLHELLLDVSAALDCSRLDWLRVLHHTCAPPLLTRPLDDTRPSPSLPSPMLSACVPHLQC